MISRNFFKAWGRQREGTVAVEFAQIVVPFIFMVIAIIELSLFFAATNMLEGSINESARMIRTGQLQEQVAAPPEEVFREAVCSNLLVLINCEDVDIEVVDLGDNGFSNVDDYAPEYDEEGHLIEREFDAGGSGSVVMIRAAYRYQLMTPLFARIFSNQPDQTIPIMSTVIMQTEPYDFGEEAS